MPLALPEISRRLFIRNAGIGLAGLAVTGPTLAASYPAPVPSDIGKVENGKVEFSKLSRYEAPKKPTKAPLPAGKRVGYAVVALGRLSLDEILPAFAESKSAKLVALVSGTPDKAKAVAAQYDIKAENIYSYENFDAIKDNKDIQAVYIVLPNAMHREFVERAAMAGKHVLCEKPLATGPEDARAMVEACKKAGVKLMTAYRCQYEPYNRELTRIVRSGELGKLRFIETNNSQSEGDPTQWRLKKSLAGGGALPDIGLYCLNTSRAITGEEPSEVFAYMSSPADDPRFREVEERMSFLLRFPSGVVANCATSYDAYNSKDLTARLEKGWIKLDDAYAYHGKKMNIGASDGKKPTIENIVVGEENQFALELDHFAECVAGDVTPRTPGEEGLQDHVVMAALYKSAQTGRPVALEVPDRLDAMRGPALKD